MEKQKRIRIKYTSRLGSFIKGLFPRNRRFSLYLRHMTHTLLSKDKDEDTYRGTIEPRYNEVLFMTNSFLYPSNSKIYEKESRYNETLL